MPLLIQPILWFIKFFSSSVLSIPCTHHINSRIFIQISAGETDLCPWSYHLTYQPALLWSVFDSIYWASIYSRSGFGLMTKLWGSMALLPISAFSLYSWICLNAQIRHLHNDRLTIMWWHFHGGQEASWETWRACALARRQWLPLNWGLQGDLGKRWLPAGRGETALEMFCVTDSSFTQIFSNLQLHALLSRVSILH